jgi:hypothetical protein
MALKRLIILSAILVPFSLVAETASDYVHRGAQKYIFGQDAAAEAEITTGLRKFPNDPELQEMTKLIRKKPPKDNSGQNQKQQSSQKDNNQQDKQESQSQQNQNQNGRGENQQQQQQQQQNGQDKSLAQNNPQPNQQPQAGESPSPGAGQPNEEKNSGSGQKDQPQNSPSPGEGQNNAPPSPSPGEGEGSGEGASPSPQPSATPQKKFAGEIKGTGQEKPEKPEKPDQSAKIGEAEPDKEGEMSERQARALLESMKDEEARVQLNERRATRHVYNDW